MKKQIIQTVQAPQAIGPYSQGISVNELIFTSGQIPVNPKSGYIARGIEEQTKQCLENLKAVLEEGGGGLDTVLKTVVYIRDMESFSIINSIYEQYIEQPYPSRSCVEVARLPKDVLIEIEAIAYKK